MNEVERKLLKLTAELQIEFGEFEGEEKRYFAVGHTASAERVQNQKHRVGSSAAAYWRGLYEIASRERAELGARIAELEAAQVTQENEEVGPKLTPDETLILTVLFMHGPMNEQEFKPFIENVPARTFFSLWEAEAGLIVFNEGRFSITPAGRRALDK